MQSNQNHWILCPAGSVEGQKVELSSAHGEVVSETTLGNMACMLLQNSNGGCQIQPHLY
jgi:hypothetical protein